MNSQNNICQLCYKRAKLLRRSHIIPTFMYNGLFDETNRAYHANLKDADRSKHIQTGYYDKYILCEKCDNVLFGKLERYAALLLYGESKKVSHTIKTEPLSKESFMLTVTDTDEKNFKLFVLSILWRAHISRNPFFEKINIGGLEPLLRSILLNGDPGLTALFRISIIGIKESNDEVSKFIIDPDMRMNGKLFFAHFIINQLIYCIELDLRNEFLYFNHFPLFVDGIMKIPFFTGSLAAKILRTFGLPDPFVNQFLEPI